MTRHTRVVVPRYMQHEVAEVGGERLPHFITSPTLRDVFDCCLGALIAGVPGDAVMSLGGYDLSASWETER